MPFKTRRRKESAVERRFAWNRNQEVKYLTPEGQARAASSFDGADKTKMGEAKKITEGVNTRADLVKIILAACAIVSAQVILSFLHK